MKHVKAVCAAVAVLALVAVMTGCSATIKQAPGAGINGVSPELLKCNSEYVILDTIKAKGEMTKILGMPWPWFGGDNQYGYVQSSVIGGFWKSKDAVAVATYNALMDPKAQQADTILPLTTTCSGNGFPPFYIHETATITAKAVQIKAK